MVLKINTYIYISSNTDENTLSNHISIPKVEEYVSKHGLLRTDYLHKCFKTNFTYTMTALIKYIWFTTCATVYLVKIQLCLALYKEKIELAAVYNINLIF